MKNDYIYAELEKHNADGIDFVPIWFDHTVPAPIICAYTKEEWETHDGGYPKSDRRYWKIDTNGRKQYCDGRPSKHSKTCSMSYGEAANRIEDHMMVHHMEESQAIKISEALQMAIEVLRQKEQENELS